MSHGASARIKPISIWTQAAQFKTRSELPSYIANRSAVRSHQCIFGGILHTQTTYARVRAALLFIWGQEGRVEHSPLRVHCDGELAELCGSKLITEHGVNRLLQRHLEVARGEPVKVNRTLPFTNGDFPRLQ